MAGFRSMLPQLGLEIFLTDSGIETDLIFNRGIDLAEFAAFPLLDSNAGVAALVAYYAAHLDVATAAGVGFILEAPTWRANADWGARLGYDAAGLDRLNRAAVVLLQDLQGRFADPRPKPISGCVGPRHDAYRPAARMTAEQARSYHRPQIETFAATSADLVTAMTLTYATEGIGIAQAARDCAMPVVLSFTVETDGRLPDGTSLADTIAVVDETTDGYPAYFMINCAHPTHLDGVLEPGTAWPARVRGLRANASRRSHAELDDATDLDAGDPDEFGREYAALRAELPGLTVLGGCCGTDVRHVSAVARACAGID